MKQRAVISFAEDIAAFLAFKRALGHPYQRGEFTLRAFQRFAQSRRAKREPLPTLLRAWISRRSERTALTLAAEHTVIRQFCLFRRRRDGGAFVPPRSWAPASTKSRFVPYIFSTAEVRQLIRMAGSLKRPVFRGVLYRTLLLTLYCTGLRFGEALRLRIRDVDVDGAVLFIATSKGRARWVPFHRSLAVELRRYLKARRFYASTLPDAQFFVGLDRKRLPIRTASGVVCGLLRAANIKPSTGRSGPRPYDFRHAFAVHRLERWYRAKVDIDRRLPWLSSYMGHENLLGTETYLHATPQLLRVAANRLRGQLTGEAT